MRSGAAAAALAVLVLLDATAQVTGGLFWLQRTSPPLVTAATRPPD